MAQDRSRSAFDYRQPKHWSSVQAQQGRLLSDDDWNEGDAITKEDLRRTRVDVIGPDGSPDDGFRISNPRISAQGVDFDLAAGTLYAGGLRVTLEQTESFALQKDWLEQTTTDRSPLGNSPRIDLVYLEVWQQPVTAVEDDELREIALGGPDTSVRVRTMRRVRIKANVGTDRCNDAWKQLGTLGAGNEATLDATLTVGYVNSTGAEPNLCSPTAQGGYLGAENQAIRVEIRSNNTFVWGYDNASPLYRVQVTTDESGQPVVHFLQAPRDQNHWPLSHQIVELLPWSAVLPNGEKVAEVAGGMLAAVTASYDPDTKNIAVTPTVPTTFGADWLNRSDHLGLGTDTSSYLYLRVWNRGADTSTPAEIPFTPGKAVELTGTGLSVTFTGTQLHQGDYWIIAARPGSKVVPWTLEKGLLAEGIRRFYAPLGLIQWQPPGGPHAVSDCRSTFDPLTRQRGCCIDIAPHSGWEHIIDEIADDDDVCICFQPGDFEATRTLVFNNKHVKIRGAGAATRITGPTVETVFLFNGCATVEIADLSVRAKTQLQEGKAAPRPHLAGVITITGCDRVDLRNVTARCAAGTSRSAACLALYNAPSTDGARERAAVARVVGCELIVGANQIGLSVINFGRSTIEDNNVHVDAEENKAIPTGWLQDKAYRRTFRRTLIYGYSLADGVSSSRGEAGNLQIGGDNRGIWINVPSKKLLAAWATVVAVRPFRANRFDYMTVGEYLHGLAEDLVYAIGALGSHKIPEFGYYFAALLKLRTSETGVRTIAAQGIVVAGVEASEVRIVGNTVRDAVQGIHVGISKQRVRTVAVKADNVNAVINDAAGRVVISHNVVNVTLMPESSSERHGIFVGNCRSLLIEDNHLKAERLGDAASLKIEGIRVYGLLGRMACIKRNHLIGFSTGIRFAALNGIGTEGTNLWRVNENLAEHADPKVSIALKFGDTAGVNIDDNMG